MPKRAGLAAIGMILALGLGAAPASAPIRRSVPDAAARESMEKLVHELYGKEYADRSSARRRELAGKLLEQADRTPGDLVARYVLLKEAVDLARQGQDSTLAMRGLTLMGRDYDVDQAALKEAAIRLIVPHLQSPAQARTATDDALELADEALARGDEQAAGRLIQLAQAAANHAGQVELALRVVDHRRELGDFRREQAAYAEASRKLAAGEASAAERLLVGRVRCFYLGDWERGLPLLADCEDARLKSAARAELSAGAGDALAGMRVANGWWDIAQQEQRLARRRILLHAAAWYRLARPGLGGVDQAIAEQRLARVPLTAEEIAALKPGLAAEIFSGQNFDHLLIRRVDPRIDFDWGTGPVGPTLPKDDFSLRWRGYLLAEREGTYTFILLANSGGRVAVNGTTLIDSPKITARGKGARAQVHLPAGAHAFRAEAWDGGGAARAIVQWIMPGESRAATIPAEAFRHE